MATIKSLRLHIGIFGKTNAGKSTLLNHLTNQDVAIVSDIPGTTTDPIEKAMELKPFGPVLFIDTAGFDDASVLGEKRIDRTIQYFSRSDIAVLVSIPSTWNKQDRALCSKLRESKIPFCICFTKEKRESINQVLLSELTTQNIPYFVFEKSDSHSTLLANFTSAIFPIVPKDWIHSPRMVGDFLQKDDLVVLVIPIDSEAPKDRIILPQQQAIRDVLDSGANSLVTSVKGLPKVLSTLSVKPRLVITDSQAFKEVFSVVPDDIYVTGFSILLSRIKGDLQEFYKGIRRIDLLKDGDRVLILEACSHNPVCNDIGRDQIPNGLLEKTKKKLTFDIKVGHDFPTELEKYNLIIHCGACVLNKKEVCNRISRAKTMGIPITNYGMVLSYLTGDIDRAMKIFKP